jgi:hypothetical protein
MIEIINYPQGNIIEVTQKEFDVLNELDLIMFDDEWNEETPNGQWGFNEVDEVRILKIIKVRE